MNNVNRLFRTRNPYSYHMTEQLFVNAMRENCQFQYSHCEEYKRLLDYRQFMPESLIDYKGLGELPFLPTLTFKKHSLYSVSKKRMIVKVTSSGTKGSFSRIAFELPGLWRALKMSLRIVRRRKLLSLKPVNYIVFGYKPHKSNHTGVTKTAFATTLLAPGIRRAYALHYSNGKYTPDLEGVIKTIEKYGKSKFPTRFMGFPAYTYFVLKLMEERNIQVKLPKGSKIMMAGGWKQFYLEQVDKTVVYQLAEKVLGILEEDIVEFFGAVEHPVLYCDCVCHHFHVPVYGRVLIRDVNTLEPVPNGKIGLVNLLTPMIKATPILSVMTDDLGILHNAEECSCGIKSPYLEIIGRVGLKEIKTCAAGAGEILSGAKI